MSNWSLLVSEAVFSPGLAVFSESSQSGKSQLVGLPSLREISNNPPADRTPWQSALPLWSAGRSCALAAGSLRWAAAGTRPRSPTRSGRWRRPAPPAGSAVSRTVQSGPWTWEERGYFYIVRLISTCPACQLAIRLAKSSESVCSSWQNTSCTLADDHSEVAGQRANYSEL